MNVRIFCAAASVIAAVFFFVLSDVCEAQGTQPATIIEWVGTGTCEAGDCDDCGAYCGTATFTVPSTGTYYLCTKLVCTSGSCETCQSCANLKQLDSTFIANAHTTCPSQGTTCSNNTDGITLTVGIQYGLCVCLRICSGTCNGCGCYASAWISTTPQCG